MKIGWAAFRDRKVRDVLWQALATVGLVVVVVFFVRNASDNMVKAGIASGFQFLWRDSGIEVPFNITGYKPGQRLTLVRNPSWDKSTDFKPAYFDRIEET